MGPGDGSVLFLCIYLGFGAGNFIYLLYAILFAGDFANTSSIYFHNADP